MHASTTHTESADPFTEFLRAIAGNPDLQARFLNTLSLLEYTGARKILKSQPEETMSLELLAHASEELRHAKTLKRVAERLSGGRVQGYSDAETLCGSEARAYFQGLDRDVEARLKSGSARENYLLTTLLIEERALWAYPKIMDSLPGDWILGAGRSILADEERHLKSICDELESRGPTYRQVTDRLRSIETSLFEALSGAWWSAAVRLDNPRSDESPSARSAALA
jgi:hypothetical protein